LNIFRLFYGIVAGLLSRLHIYEERAGKYLNYFKHYVDKHYVDYAKIVVDVGCGTGAFSKALASNRHPVIALDIESRLLREFENPYIEKICADAQQLPLRDGSVDAVLSLTSRAS
jgi:ubiquinone/menaquinone biosynthesis C-methylase UbiE